MDEERQPLTPEFASHLLLGAGFDVAPDEIRVEQRDERSVAFMPGKRILWYPASEVGRQRLNIEGRTLKLLEQRCSFAAPRIIFESDAGWQIRTMVAGVVDPWGMLKLTQENLAFASDIGRAMGLVLAEQHTQVLSGDVDGWLPTRPAWPEPRDWIEQRLPWVIDDLALLHDIHATMDACEALVIDKSDCVLVHGDLGLHNIVVDPTTKKLRGVFDYDGSAWADRNLDFRYFIFDEMDDEPLEAGIAAYESKTGLRLDRRRIRIYNAFCAISFLAYRDGIAPERIWCGRTLEGDLKWTRGAITRAQQAGM